MQQHKHPRIVFMGAVEFSDYCLYETLKHNGNIVGVITLDPMYSSRHSDYSDLSQTAIKHSIPYYKIKNISNPESLNILTDLQPDYLFVFGWSQLLSEEVLSAPNIGCIGTHPALLPRNRGRHPLIWSLINNEDKGGLTFLYLDSGVDSGDIVWQKSFDITQIDDAGTLYAKIKSLAAEAIPELLRDMTRGPLKGTKQNDQVSNYLRKRSEKDGEIDWSQPANQIQNLVRALTHPYVGAHSYYDGDKITIWRTRILDIVQDHYFRIKPGAIFEYDNKFPCVATKSQPIQILNYDISNNNMLENGSYLGQNI